MLNDVLLYIAVGFAAQMVDGALGMAYGLTATTVLLSLGTAPATASASVHAAEMFTTAASGAAHWRLGHVDRRIMWRLAAPGVAGGLVGAFVLTSFPGDQMRPLVAAYLLIAGGVVLARGLNGAAEATPHAMSGPRLVLIGLAGGFLDAVGGGGWGALVTSSLLWCGAIPRTAIGTVNAAEFFVTTAVSAAFLATIGFELWPVIAGLIVGGVIAAPLAALAARHMPDRPMMILVGSLIVLLSVRQLVKALA